MRRFAIILIALGALAALAVLAIGETLSRPVQATVGVPPADIPFASVAMQVPGGQAVHGWFARGHSGAGSVLLLHGVRSNRLVMLDRARFLSKLGYSVLLIDLPAHGESQAEHITFGLDESHGVKAAYAFLAHETPGEKIGVIGVSLGAASFMLAHPIPPASAVVLESMYPTIDEAVTDRLRLHVGRAADFIAPLLLWQLPVRFGIAPAQLRPIDALPAMRSPVLIASGSLDQHTTLAETRRIFAAAGQPKELWIVEGAAHVDLHAHDRAAYEARISSFLARYLRGAGWGVQPGRRSDHSITGHPM